MSEHCFEPLLKRRSIRVFKDEEVPLDLVLKAIDVARYAPSAGNRQPWRFIVIRDRSRIEALAKILKHPRPLLNAKTAVLVLANKDESPVSYMVDASLAAMYFWLALHCTGLGAVWIQTLRNVEEILEFVGAPSNYVPIGLFAIGWPGEQPVAKERKHLSEIVFLERLGEALKQ
ncbi:MAG: nitroreductase family protein [Thermosphaera sp.]|nr:nitroreductase family protein [Thermosphaera sp.]